jgi:hypothetical protein
MSRAGASLAGRAATAYASMLTPPMPHAVSHKVRRRAPAATIAAPTVAQISREGWFNGRVYMDTEKYTRMPNVSFGSAEIQAFEFPRGITEVLHSYPHAIHHAQVQIAHRGFPTVDNSASGLN